MSRYLDIPVFRRKRPRAPHHVRNPYVDFSRPGGKWCIVARCPDCRRMGHYETGYANWRSLYAVTLLGRPPRVFPYHPFAGGVCSECEGFSRMFEKIAQCDCCKRFRHESQIGVTTRYDCRVEVPGKYTPPPKLCVSCWNRLRGVRAALREMDNFRRGIDRAVRERREALRAAG